MAGRGEDDIGAIRDRIGRQTVGIDRNRGQPTARLRQDIAQRVVAGVFDRGQPPLRQQHLRRQPQGILRAQRHEDFRWSRDDPAARQGVAGDEFHKLRIVLIIVIRGQRREVPRAQCLQGAKPPVGVIKKRRIRLAIDEWITKAGPVLRFYRGGTACETLSYGARPVHAVAAAGCGWRRWWFRCIVGHEIPGSALGCQIVIGQQFGIGQCHGDPADAQMRRQSAGRGQLFPAPESSGQDAARDHLLDARLQCALGCLIQEKGFDGYDHVHTLCWT